MGGSGRRGGLGASGTQDLQCFFHADAVTLGLVNDLQKFVVGLDEVAQLLAETHTLAFEIRDVLDHGETTLLFTTPSSKRQAYHA